MKQVSVTFEFDPTTELVSNLKCFVDGIEKKKTTTRSSKKKEDIVLEDEPIVKLEETKISFNNKCVADMELKWEDRIIIKYEKIKGVKKPVPLIGKDISFDQEGSGNKLTKTNTVAYRGKANTVLAEYGNEFTIQPYLEGSWANSEGIYKLVPISNVADVNCTDDNSYEEIVKEAENIDLTVFTKDNENIEIDEMTFKL